LVGFFHSGVKGCGYMALTMREAMKRKGLSFRDLGFLTDLDAGYLCRVASGKRRLSRPAAFKVARVLEVAPRRLVPNQETKGD
jgi:transcriptional regulator with XRE-family HTH domain